MKSIASSSLFWMGPEVREVTKSLTDSQCSIPRRNRMRAFEFRFAQQELLYVSPMNSFAKVLKVRQPSRNRMR